MVLVETENELFFRPILNFINEESEKLINKNKTLLLLL